MLSELNSSSEAINILEKTLADALSRKRNLLDSIPRPSSPKPTLNDSEPGTSSGALYTHLGLYSKQGMLKKKIEEQVAEFCRLTSEYETVRHEFDALALHSSNAAMSISAEEQCKLSACSVEVMAAQSNRDFSESEYVRLMNLYRQSMIDIAMFEKRASRETVDYYTQVEKLNLNVEDDEIDRLHTEIQLCKKRYRGAMLRLEEVSNSMHSNR